LLLVVSHAILITCHRPCTQSCSPIPVYQMDKIKRNYKQAKGKVKDLLQLPSHQSAITTPARSPHSSQPSTTHYHTISTAPSATVRASQEAVAPTANVTSSADIPALDAEPSPRPEHARNYDATSARPEFATKGEERRVVEAKEPKKKKSEKTITAG